ncbi:MAG TPA: hypothetical protein VES61_03925, partial [Gaiellaceae bacterium]|nr:hypothetical protein [Gaiellaceae bacterium]
MSARTSESPPSAAAEHPEDLDRTARILSGSVIDSALAALDRDGIQWCLLRGDVEARAPGDDVDLLVAQGALARASTVLDRAGFLPLAADGRGSHVFFV